MINKTYSAKPKEVVKEWLLIDASNLILGRLSVIVANFLRGKHKAIYTPHVDCGDNVVIINAEKVVLTGKKLKNKTYYHHTGYPGGIKSITAEKVLQSKFPQRIIQKSIERMISRNSLGRLQMKKLYVYSGNEHPHQGQKPKIVDIASINKKNTKINN